MHSLHRDRSAPSRITDTLRQHRPAITSYYSPSALHLSSVKRTHARSEITLDKRDRQLIRNIQKGRFADPEFDPYEVFGDPGPVSIHPMTNEDEPKRRFIPSKWEAQRVNYLVQAIKKGWIKTGTLPWATRCVGVLCVTRGIGRDLIVTNVSMYHALTPCRQGALPEAAAEALPHLGPGHRRHAALRPHPRPAPQAPGPRRVVQPARGVPVHKGAHCVYCGCVLYASVECAVITLLS